MSGLMRFYCVCVCVCVCACVRADECASMRAGVRACVRACVLFSFLCLWAHESWSTFVSTLSRKFYFLLLLNFM